MDIKDSYLHGTVGVVKSISVNADKLTYNLADVGNTAKTVTLPLATTTANGLLSSTDKTKLDNLSTTLGNYVTVGTDQQVTGVKTFTKQQKFTVAQGTSPFTVTSTTKVVNLNADYLDGISSDGFIRYSANIDGSTTTSSIAHIGYAYSTQGWHTSGPSMSIGVANGYIMQMQQSAGGNSVYVRYGKPDGFGDWKQIAFTDSNITGNAATANKVNNNLVIKVNTGSTEGTSLYTYNGSTAKTLDIKNGTGIGFTNTAGVLSIYNSGVRSISTGTANGTISVNTNGTSANVAVKGLGSAAYTNSTAYAVRQTLSTEDLNTVTTPGFYNCGGGNTCTNKPEGVDHFGMYVIHCAGGTYYVQILFEESDSTRQWRRHCIAGTWSAWTLDKLSDTTYSVFAGATASADGTSGLVPKPTAGNQGKFLKADGTWATPTNTTYNVVSSSANGLAPKVINTNTATVGTAYYVLASSDGSATPSWYKLPSNAFVNDDTKVTQTNTTTSASYRVLLSGNANNTTETTTARKSANLTFNPSTGTLNTPISNITNQLVIANTGNAKHILFSRGKDTDYQYNYIAAPEGGYICILPNGVTNSSTSGMQFTDEGLRPATNAAYSLGTTSLKWNSVYANTFVGSLTGNATTATKLATKRKLWGQDFDGSADVSGDMTGVGVINKVFKVTSIQHIAQLNVSEESSDINYSHLYVSSNNTSYPNTRPLVLQYGYGNVGIGVIAPSEKLEVVGNVKATSFIGNLDGTYINKLTEYSKASSASNLAATDTLNSALGKLEYKAHYAYDWVIGVTATDTDEYINKWGEIVGFLDSVKEGTDILDEFVTTKTAQTITGLKTFQADGTIFTNGTYGARLLGHGDSGWLQLGQTSGENRVHHGKISGISGTTLTSLGVSATASSFSGTVTATKFIKSGGTSSQFLKADGSVDSNTYLTSLPSHNHDTSYVKWAKVTKAEVEKTTYNPYIFNIENENLIENFQSYWYVLNFGSYSGGGFRTQIAMPYQNSLSDSELFIRSASGSTWRDWRRALHSGNYTTWINTTNFPGLNKTGTVTSIKVGSTSYSPSSGVVSLPAYPTSLKNPNAIKFKNTAGTEVSYDGSAAVDLTGGVNNAKQLDGNAETSYLRYRGEIDTTYADLTDTTVNHANFKKPSPGMYTIRRTGSSEMLVSFAMNTGSCSSLEFKVNYPDTARLYIRKVVDSNRISGDWRALAWYSDIPTALKNPNKLTFAAGTFAAKTYDGSAAVTVNIPTHTSHLTNDSGYLTSRGYIGTTQVQASSAEQALTGISTATAKYYVATQAMSLKSSGLSNDLTVANRGGLFSNGVLFNNPTTPNDVGFIRIVGTGETDTVLEIGTGDDGASTNSEAIAARLYRNGAVAKEAWLLDTAGNTSFPGNVKAQQFTYNFLSASAQPFIYVGSSNQDITLLRVYSSDQTDSSYLGAYGYSLKYLGTGSGVGNYLNFYADNKAATAQTLALSIDNSGNVGIKTSANETYALKVSGAANVTSVIYSDLTTSTYINGNTGQAIICSKAAAGSYTMLAKMNSTNGYFTHGTYGSNYLLQYTAKTTVDAGTNAVTKQVILLDESGNSSFPGSITSTGFKKSGSSSSYVLLGDGGHKAISDFAAASHGVHWEGFTRRTSSYTWGTLIESNSYTPLFWLDSTSGGGVAFSDKGGQTFMQIDGYFYQKEGSNRVTDVTETVTALGTNGNNLTWTKNGTTNKITIPYSTVAGSISATTAVSSKAFNLSNTTWTDTGYTFTNLATGTYAIQVTSGTNLVASGIMSVYKNLSDTAGDEIPLHVYGTTVWRPYLRTYQNKLQISSNDASATSRTVTIKIAQIL